MKYKLTDEKINQLDVTLFRIKALKSFGNVKEGDLGGYIEKGGNLSQYDTCWVFDNARVSGDARVFGNAIVFDNARVFGDAIVFGDARVFGSARVFGDASVFDNARISGNAMVSGDAMVSGEDKITGFITNLINVCEFNITASKRDSYIRVGCRGHTVLEWASYIESGEYIYLEDCENDFEHEKCLLNIKNLITLFEME